MGGIVEGGVLNGDKHIPLCINYGRRFSIKTKEEAVSKIVDLMVEGIGNGFDPVPTIFHYPDRRTLIEDEKPEEIPFTTTTN